MKGVNMMTLCILFTVCCLLVLIACRQKTQKIKNPAILGKWETSNQTIEIFEDGKFILNDKMKKEGLTGSYKFIDDDRIRVKSKGSRPKDFKVSISQDKLIANSADSDYVTKYKRVQ